jgi:DNA-binding CsgD family transcriptional regulator/tetratricopeptide (TPR) repeat protein
VALEEQFAFGVARQLFESVLAGASEPERRELLSGAAALGGALFGFGLEDGPRPVADATFASLHGLYWLCFNLAVRAPVLIAIDDAHWADAASLRFVNFLAARLEGMPVLVVLALRPSERGLAGELLDIIRSEPAATVLSPHELSERASDELLTEAFGRRAAPAFCRACFEVTGGNPFYLRALATGLRSDGVAPVAEHAGLVAAQVPDTVVRALVLRLSRLPHEAAELARATAVLGPDAELRDAAALAGIPPANAGASADQLAAAGILAPRRPLRFMHPIIQAAVYGDLPPAERSRMHLQAARALAAAGAAAERVASHVLASEAGGDPWNVEALRKASTEALMRGAPDSAVTYLERALSERLSAEENAQVLHELGTAEFLSGQPVATDHLAQALELTADVRRRGAIAITLGNAFTIVDRFPDSVAVLERAIEDLGGADPVLAQALEAQLLGAAALHLSTRPAHREHLARVRELELGDSPTERELLANLALWGSSEGEPASVVLALAERALAAGKLLDEVTADSQMFYAAVNALLYIEEFDRARYWYDRAFADARGRGSLFGFALASAMRSECDYRMGDLAEAEADARAAIEAGGAEHWVLAPVAVGTLAQVLVERGELVEAEKLLAEWSVPSGLDQPGMTNWLPYAHGKLQLATGRWEAAAQSLLAVGEWMQAWGERDPGLLDWRSSAALALAGLGDVERARELSEEVISLGRVLGKPRSLGVGLRVAGVISSGDEAIERLRDAVGVLADAPARLEHARALVDLGAALRRQNQRREAREPLRTGIELARRCGASALVERGQSELVASGARPRRVASTGVEALTPSERRVAGLGAHGLSTPEIAQQLFVTVNTVESHLRHVYAKLGIHSREELAPALNRSAADQLTTVG